MVSPGHAYPMGIRDMAPGVAPAKEDPERPTFDQMQADAQKLYGLLIWLEKTYVIELPMGTNTLCGEMSSPTYKGYKDGKHMLMHLASNHSPVVFRRSPTGHLRVADTTVAPFTEGEMEYGLHSFADSDVTHTGAVDMLGGACVDSVSQRQHLAAPDAFTGEITSTVTVVNRLAPKRGLLQEARISQVLPTPLYVDSIGTVRTGESEGAVKKSVWVRRKINVLNDAYDHNEVAYTHIDEADNVADGASKPIKKAVYKRHASYMAGRWPCVG